MEPEINLENWMSQLPKCCYNIPLNCLALPGSHNSFTFNLDKTGPLSSDAPEAVSNLAKIFGPLAKSIIHNWSTCQSLSVEDQLKAGIRYFDIRVGSKAGSEEFYAVHGLYGPSLTKCFDEIFKFLDSHPREIVLLDFNHFYDLSSTLHDRLVQNVISRFSSKMCPVMDINEVTLQTLWDNGLQLLVFYQYPPVLQQHFQLWSSNAIQAPWYNKTSTSELLRAVAGGLADRAACHSCVFYVTQGILTPDNGCIMTNMGGTLKSCLCSKVAGPLVELIQQQKAGVGGINVIIVDFVEMADFVANVVRLNFRLI